jgi:hypothetical protein
VTLGKFSEDRREKSKHGAKLFEKGFDEVFEVLGISWGLGEWRGAGVLLQGRGRVF